MLMIGKSNLAWHIKNGYPKCLKNGCLAAKVLSLEKDMEDVQRLSPWGRVKPQANGGRKILPHTN